jgi:hypothetical protein
MTGETLWHLWQTTGAEAGYRVPLSPHGGNVRVHMQAIRELVTDAEELEQAMRLWWASPAITPDKRSLGMFSFHLTGVLHHLDMGFTHPFGTTLPARLGIRGSKTQDNAASVAAAIANFQVRES